MAGISPGDYLEMIAPADEEICYLEFFANSYSGQNFFLSSVAVLLNLFCFLAISSRISCIVFNFTT